MDARDLVNGIARYRRRHCVFVVLADTVLTATAVIAQPLTGMALLYVAGYPLLTPWILISIALYGLIGCCWLPAVWLQVRMRNMAIDAVQQSVPLPRQYRTFYRWWFALGWPAFIGVLVIFYLMVAKPVL